MSLRVGEIIDQSLRLVNRVDPNFRVRALDAVDRAVRYYAERLPWPGLEREEQFVSNGTRDFTFPRRVRSVISIGDVNHDEYVRPGDNWHKQYPVWDVGGEHPTSRALQWDTRGFRPVIQAPPSDGSKLLVETTQSEAIPVRVRGLVFDSQASGTALELYEQEETISANVTAVQSSNTFRQIYAIEKDSLDSDSDVVIKYASETSPAARIATYERTPRYLSIKFLAQPDAGDPFLVRYHTGPPRIAAEDTVLDPGIDPEPIVWRVVGDLHWMQGQGQAAGAARQTADELLTNKIRQQESHGDNLAQAIPYAPFIEPDETDVF